MHSSQKIEQDDGAACHVHLKRRKSTFGDATNHPTQRASIHCRKYLPFDTVIDMEQLSARRAEKVFARTMDPAADI
jgi:hypothetical protein